MYLKQREKEREKKTNKAKFKLFLQTPDQNNNKKTPLLIQ
jgi:hypothetical protein